MKRSSNLSALRQDFRDEAGKDLPIAAIGNSQKSGVMDHVMVLGFPLIESVGTELSVMVQRQLEKVRVAANERVLLFWLRLVLRVSLAWRSFWSRVAKMASSLPASLSTGGDVADRGVKPHGIVVFDEAGDQATGVLEIQGDAWTDAMGFK
jgi:hypothetical protein